jgi:hypothetical protein
MNDIDLRAIGWVMTRDVAWDIVRGLCGMPPRLSAAALTVLHRGWRALQAAAYGSLQERLQVMLLRRARLPLAAELAATNLVAAMNSACPALYAPEALHGRCTRGWAQAGIGLVGGVACARWASPDLPVAADAALVLFVMTMWHCAASLQLWCVLRVARRIARERAAGAAGPVAPGRAPRTAPPR